MACKQRSNRITIEMIVQRAAQYMQCDACYIDYVCHLLWANVLYIFTSNRYCNNLNKIMAIPWYIYRGLYYFITRNKCCWTDVVEQNWIHRVQTTQLNGVDINSYSNICTTYTDTRTRMCKCNVCQSSLHRKKKIIIIDMHWNCVYVFCVR